jgi:hypothetical protein
MARRDDDGRAASPSTIGARAMVGVQYVASSERPTHSDGARHGWGEWRVPYDDVINDDDDNE